MREVDSFEGFGERSDLVWLDQYTVCRFLLDSLLDPGGCSDEEIVTADQAPFANLGGEFGKTCKVLFVERILYIEQVVTVYEFADISDLFLS